MDTCAHCGSTQPYLAVLRACVRGRTTELSCRSCGRDLTNRTPLVGMQILWIGAGASVLFRGASGGTWNTALTTSVALALWIATFWIATPWLCRFEPRSEASRREAERTPGN